MQLPGAILFSAFYAAMDLGVGGGDRGGWDGWPLREVGKNSILLYMGHEILDGFLPFAVYFTTESEDRHWGVVLSNALGVTAWVCVALWLDERKIWVSV